MLSKQRKSNGGFTIIEVMIVLAIAGLILLIVFLAVPALQRSQRNSSRKSDAGHIETAINDFIANNNGTLPGNTGGTGTSWAADCLTMIGNSSGTGDAGTLSEYNNANSFVCGAYTASPGAITKNQFTETNGIGKATAVTGQAMMYDTDGTCPATTGTTTATTTAANSPDSSALLYTTETSSGSWDWECIQL